MLVLLKLAPGQEMCANVVHRYSLADQSVQQREGTNEVPAVIHLQEE